MGSVTQAKSSISQDPEYRKMLEQLNRSYEGFFIHENEAKRWDRIRRSGASESKKKREKYEKEREKIRKGFVRKPPPDMEPARLKWEAKQAKEEKERDKIRERYVKKRTEIEKVRESARKIPENKEFGLED